MTFREQNLKYIRWTIWTYFWLLLLEGALRKWVVPQLAAPLLIVRDPVVLAAYFFALRAGLFPRNLWVYSLGGIAFITFLISFIPLWDYLPPWAILLVAGYGFRCNYLHIPLIFLIASTLRIEDVKKFGWWILILMPPMTALLVAQFQAPPDSFLNRTSRGEDDVMMMAALGKVRTAGPFSFVVGVAAYFALAGAYLVWGALRRNVYKPWLLLAAGGSLIIGIAVSGSRSVVVACALVIVALAIVVFVRPGAVSRLVQVLVVVALAALLLSQTPIFKEGFEVLSTRFVQVAEASDTSIGGSLLERLGEDLSNALYVFPRAPFLGWGLGVGTNGGARMLIGRATFLLSEVEWSRIFLENGPVFGLTFVLWRIAFTIQVGLRTVAAARRAGLILPALLFSTGAFPLLSGQLGQPTIAGFMVFSLGLTLAALREEEEVAEEKAAVSVESAEPVSPRVPRNSPYARRLHQSASGRSHPNGSVDR